MNPLLKRYFFGVVIAAVLIVLLTPPPQATSIKASGATDGWFVPRMAPQPGNAARVLRDLVQSRLWGAPADNASTVDDKASRWRIAGITGRTTERFVIVQFGDDRIQQLKAGDKFPDGTLISEVRERGTCVLLGSTRRFLPIDGQMQPAVW